MSDTGNGLRPIYGILNNVLKSGAPNPWVAFSSLSLSKPLSFFDELTKPVLSLPINLCSVQPPKDNLGIFTPTWFTSATFLSNDDHRKFVTGTKSHQVKTSSFFCQFGYCPDHSHFACAGDRFVFMTFLLSVDQSCPLISVRPPLQQSRKTQTVILSMSGMPLLTWLPLIYEQVHWFSLQMYHKLCCLLNQTINQSSLLQESCWEAF